MFSIDTKEDRDASASSVKVSADLIEIHVDPRDTFAPEISITHRGETYRVSLLSADEGLFIQPEGKGVLASSHQNGSDIVHVYYVYADNPLRMVK